MNINQYIESVLSDMVDGNIWPLVCPLEDQPREFITYGSEYEDPADFGDDSESDSDWVYHLEINWFSMGHMKMYPADYLTARNELRRRLRDAGFTIVQIPAPYHERDTGYTRLTILVSIEERDSYGDAG